MENLWWTIGLLAILPIVSDTVDHSKFKTCDQSGFCKRQRATQEGTANYEVDIHAGTEKENMVEFPVLNKKDQVHFILQIFTMEDGAFRIKMNEAKPIRPRYEVEHALLPELAYGRFEVKKASDHWAIQSGVNAVKVFGNPFRIEAYANGEMVTVINGRSTLKFEHLRLKPDANDEQVKEEGEEEKPEEEKEKEEIEPKMWEESYGGNTDSKPRGPESIGVDIDFPHTEHLYGLPEHTDNFMLKDTRSGEPHRLYNLDVFEYELDSGMAIYGAIPYVIAHGVKNTVGVLWLNAAETWVDIGVGSGSLVDSLVNLVGVAFGRFFTVLSFPFMSEGRIIDAGNGIGGSKEENMGRTRFMSESGIIDITVFMGPRPSDVIRQYAKVTGTTPLPQTWAIAYQQCRWNYNDEEDVRNVDLNFDLHDIPYDSLWLDIEHTDGKKYFTWDAHKFPNSIQMIGNLTAKGRKMVTIIDPHIKRESGYFVHENALSDDLYVKDRHGKVYEGWCWPGSSSYLDFFDPKTRAYWASLFALDKYVGSTLDLYTWNDMNEPSVFNGPEVTMPKDMVHYGDWEHRDVHNLYGLMQVISTFEGHLLRSEGKLRPFILSRANFVGTQRYAAIWTGDNMANWGHLKASIPMCLGLSIAGITHCGADIGGFFHNPDPELLLRWYQAAVFQPFVRNHAHIETKRREPWLFGDKITALIRSAVRRRYALLPYWYTLFYENEKSGAPPMRPLWYDFPGDTATFPIQDQHLVGSYLLVHPVTDQGATSVNVYLPEGIWYDFYSYKKYEPGHHTIPVDDNTIPVFQRGGSIIPTKQRIRRASSLMKKDPYTLFVAVDKSGKAHGSLYIDDGESYDYRQGKYLEVAFSFEDNLLKSKVSNPGTTFATVEWVERVVIIGLPNKPSKITGSSKSRGENVPLEFEGESTIVIRKPGFLVSEDWEIKLH